MSGYLALLVKHRVEDLIARTAEETIRRRLEGGERLERLDREEFWEFDFRAGEGFEEKLRRFTAGAELFVNPNKHHYRISEEGIFTGFTGRGWLLRVTGRDDIEGEVAKHTLIRQYGCEELQDVRYGVLWVIRLKDDEGGEGDGELAERMAITRSREDGLLVNPHFQEWKMERFE